MTALVCGVALFFDAANLPESSVVGASMPSRGVGMTSCDLINLNPRAAVYRTSPIYGGGLRVYCGMTIDLIDSVDLFGIVELRNDTSEHGWWACIERVDSIPSTVDWRRLTDAEIRAVREQLAVAAVRYERDDLAERLRTGDLTRRRPILLGYAHNAASLLAASGLLIGLVATGRLVGVAVRGSRATRERALFAQGRCPRCRYDIASIQAVARSTGNPSVRCPECGVEHRL